MPNQLTEEQEDANYEREVRMLGKNAKRRSEAPAAVLNKANGFLFRARFHTQRYWNGFSMKSRDESVRDAVQAVLEQVTPASADVIFCVHCDGADFKLIDLDDIVEWIEAVSSSGRKQVMDVVVYDYDPMEGRDAERFEMSHSEKSKEKGNCRWRRRAKKMCAIQ